MPRPGGQRGRHSVSSPPARLHPPHCKHGLGATTGHRGASEPGALLTRPPCPGGPGARSPSARISRGPHWQMEEAGKFKSARTKQPGGQRVVSTYPCSRGRRRPSSHPVTAADRGHKGSQVSRLAPPPPAAVSLQGWKPGGEAGRWGGQGPRLGGGEASTAARQAVGCCPGQGADPDPAASPGARGRAAARDARTRPPATQPPPRDPRPQEKKKRRTLGRSPDAAALGPSGEGLGEKLRQAPPRAPRGRGSLKNAGEAREARATPAPQDPALLCPGVPAQASPACLPRRGPRGPGPLRSPISSPCPMRASA